MMIATANETDTQLIYLMKPKKEKDISKYLTDNNYKKDVNFNAKL